jgi:cytochrome c-type biogenesis protein CcmF
VKTDMGKYWVTYENERKHPKKKKWFYDIRFVRKDGKEEFVLTPTAFVNVKENNGIQPEPDSRHYLGHDVFTYLTSLSDPEKKEDTATFRTTTLKKGDSLFYSKGFLILEDVITKDSVPKELFGENGRLYEAPFKIYSKTGSQYSVTSKLAFAKGAYVPVPDTITTESLVLRLEKVNADNSVEIGMKESDNVMEYVTLKAYKFPMINLLWIGVGITAIGIFMSMANRIRQNRKNKDK